MRHVSRTHRVDLDWLLDRINLCPGVQTKCVDTNQEIADILTQGSFSRERRSQLTQLFNLVTPHVRTTSHFRTTKTTRCQIGMLKLSQKVPACAQLVCVRYKWRRTTRQTMLLAWNTHPRRKRLGATISDHKASRQALLRAWKSQPLNTLQDGSSMRQQSKLQVQLTKDEFTTSDPALICQPTKWSRWSSERSSTESKLGNSERCDISLTTFPVKQTVWHLHERVYLGSATSQQRWKGVTPYLEKSLSTPNYGQYWDVASSTEQINISWLPGIWNAFGTWLSWQQQETHFTNFTTQWTSC